MHRKHEIQGPDYDPALLEDAIFVLTEGGNFAKVEVTDDDQNDTAQ